MTLQQQAPRHIAVFSGKGGVGKSTIAAAIAQTTGRAAIDCDPQLTLMDWGDRRTEPLPVVSAHLGRVPTLLEQYEKAVVDTPGSLVGNAMVALKAVDLVLIVTGDRQPELDALPATIEMAKDSGKPVVVLVNRVHPFANADPLKEYIGGFGVLVCPVVVRERGPHYRAWEHGQTAREHAPDSAAANEIQEVCRWLEGLNA